MSSGWTPPPQPPSYNQNPPPDDGTTTAQNTLQWSKHIAKIGDPLVSWINSLNAALTTSFGNVDTDVAAVQPVGAVTAYGGSVAPTRWLICDGQAVSRTTYATLFGVLGTTWGPGDGSTTFNVPDLRGRALVGAGQGTGLTNRTLGASAGAENAVLIGHSHKVPGANPVDQGTGSPNASDVVEKDSGITGQDETGASAPSETGVDKNMPPYNVMTYIIYAGV